MECPHILICGGRDFKDKDLMFNTLDNLCLSRRWTYGPDESTGGVYLANVFVIAGGATGADTLAINWAVLNFCDFKEYPANWNEYGNRAGPIRNKQMLNEGKPDLVVAFPTKNSKGTWDMIRRSHNANVETIIIQPEA